MRYLCFVRQIKQFEDVMLGCGNLVLDACCFEDVLHLIQLSTERARCLSVSSVKDVFLLMAEWQARPTVCLFIYTLPLNAERPPQLRV